MSVDMIMYRVAKLDEDDRALLRDAIVDEVACVDADWEYKFYLQADVEREPERHSEIIQQARKLELRRIVTNAKQCYIDHGMPADVKYYSSSYTPWGITVRWGDRSISIPRETLNYYSREEIAVYYGIKRQRVDAELSNWTARMMMTELEDALKTDLSYRPHRLDKETAEIMCKVLLKTHDEGDLYPSDENMNFMLELMRILVSDDDDKVFIEFQD